MMWGNELSIEEPKYADIIDPVDDKPVDRMCINWNRFVQQKMSLLAFYYNLDLFVDRLVGRN